MNIRLVKAKEQRAEEKPEPQPSEVQITAAVKFWVKEFQARKAVNKKLLFERK
jgi:hypothetical protein